MSFKTNRKSRKVFPVPVGKVVASEPSIVSFEDAGSIYVQDRSGQRYVVKYSDGHTAEVEFSDAFDPEGSEISEQEQEHAEDVEQREPVQNYSIRVVWDGAVDFQESYDSNDDDSRLKVSKSLVKRYGKLAEDFLGKTSSDLEEDLQARIDDNSGESFL